MCDSDTVLDPACTIEMLRVLEEDPQVGGVGGDVQVRSNQEFLGFGLAFPVYKPSGTCLGNESGLTSIWGAVSPIVFVGL